MFETMSRERVEGEGERRKVFIPCNEADVTNFTPLLV